MITNKNFIQWRGTWLVALSGILYGLLGYLGVMLLNDHLTISNMLFWRFFIAFLWISLVSYGLKGFTCSLPKKLEWRKLLLFGVLTYSGGSAFFFAACQYIGTGIAMVIFFSYPVFVVIFAWFFSNWRFNKYAVLSLSAVIVGLLCLKGEGKTTLNALGILYALIAAFAYGSYVYGSGSSVKNIDPRMQTLLICLGNSVVFFAWSCFDHSFFIPSLLHTWLYLVALGILATALPIQLLLEGLKYVTPVKASIISVLEPLVTVILGLILLHESLTPLQEIGIVIVLAGAIVIQFEREGTFAEEQNHVK